MNLYDILLWLSLLATDIKSAIQSVYSSDDLNHQPVKFYEVKKVLYSYAKFQIST